ncbi:SIR2 family protein [Pseudomonadota bacterium]
MTLTVDSIPKELIASYLGGTCGFFVGAGLSCSAGFPNWNKLLIGLIEKAAKDHLLTEEKAIECRGLAGDPNKYLLLAEELKEVLGGMGFKTFIEDTFLDKSIKPTPTHDLLVKLKNNMFIITTNFDRLIEMAFVKNNELQLPFKYYEASSFQRMLYRREFFLLKAHGDAQTAADKIVFTDKDYRRLLYREPGYQSALQSMFTMYSVIFIGCSLQDPELKLLLNYINAAFPEGGTQHYALMTTESTTPTECSRWRKDYNMRIISISSDNNYEDINTFLRVLQDKEVEAAQE